MYYLVISSSYNLESKHFYGHWCQQRESTKSTYLYPYITVPIYIFLNILICLYFAPKISIPHSEKLKYFLILAPYKDSNLLEILKKIFFTFCFTVGLLVDFFNQLLFIYCLLRKPLQTIIPLPRASSLIYSSDVLLPKIWVLVFWICHERKWDLGQ